MDTIFLELRNSESVKHLLSQHKQPNGDIEDVRYSVHHQPHQHPSTSSASTVMASLRHPEAAAHPSRKTRCQYVQAPKLPVDIYRQRSSNSFVVKAFEYSDIHKDRTNTKTDTRINCVDETRVALVHQERRNPMRFIRNEHRSLLNSGTTSHSNAVLRTKALNEIQFPSKTVHQNDCRQCVAWPKEVAFPVLSKLHRDSVYAKRRSLTYRLHGSESPSAGGDADISSNSVGSVNSCNRQLSEACLCSDRSVVGSSAVPSDLSSVQSYEVYCRKSADSLSTLPPVRLKSLCDRTASLQDVSCYSNQYLSLAQQLVIHLTNSVCSQDKCSSLNLSGELWRSSHVELWSGSECAGGSTGYSSSSEAKHQVLSSMTPASMTLAASK